MKETHKVVIADDHEGVRKGIKRLLEKGGDFVVVGQAKNGKEAIQLVNQQEPDLLILDVKLPILRGEEVARRLTDAHPNIKILAISSFDNPQYILGMFENGARGYLTKEEAPILLQTAAKEIIQGKSNRWISEKLKEQTGIDFQKAFHSTPTLSPAEVRIMTMLREGLSEQEIAKALAFTPTRIKRYLQILMMKYDVASLEELIQVE